MYKWHSEAETACRSQVSVYLEQKEKPHSPSHLLDPGGSTAPPQLQPRVLGLSLLQRVGNACQELPQLVSFAHRLGPVTYIPGTLCPWIAGGRWTTGVGGHGA